MLRLLGVGRAVGAPSCIAAATAARPALLQPFSMHVPVRAFSRFTRDEEEAFREIAAWGSSFKLSDIPPNGITKSFARSSGPGGQHVNKTNSKAEIRFALASASWLPPAVKARLKEDSSFRRYITPSGDVVLTAEEYRSQPQNLDACLRKLHETVTGACANVPGETSQEQRDKVVKLKNAAAARNKEMKMRQKEKKASRKMPKEW